MRYRAAQLSKRGVFAFYAEARHIADSSAPFAGEYESAFNRWLGSSDQALFFVDAIDEATLERHSLRSVLAHFGRTINPRSRSFRMVISSRNELWEDRQTQLIAGLLHLEDPKSSLRFVALESLAAEDVVAFAHAQGAPNQDALLRELRNAQLEQLVALRPSDAKAIVRYWIGRGSLDSWSNMLASTIENSVRNANRTQSRHQEFTLEAARSGLCRLAAAAIFRNRQLISFPNFSHPSAVDSQTLFPDQTPQQVSQLLAMGLLSQKGEHFVQLPQGATTSYLAAHWLHARYRAGWPIEELESELLFRPHGATTTFIPTSRAPVVGWLAGMVPEFRERLLHELPHVALFEGDPSTLSHAELVEGLRTLIAKIRTGSIDPSPTKGTLHQLARRDLAEPLLELLDTCTESPQAVSLVLRIAEAGRHTAFVAPALKLALDPSTSEVTRDAAMRVVARLGNQSQIQRLSLLAKHQDERIRVAYIEALPADAIEASAFSSLILGIKTPEYAFRVALILKGLSYDHSDSVLDAIRRQVASAGENKENYLRLATQVLSQRLSSFPSVPTPDFLPELLFLIELENQNSLFFSASSMDVINGFLETVPPIRRALWDVRLANLDNPNIHPLLMQPRFGLISGEDFPWLYATSQQVTDASARDSVQYALRVAYGRLSPTEVTALRKQTKTDSTLEDFIAALAALRERNIAARMEYDEKQKRDRQKKQQERVKELVPRIEKILKGEDINALLWASHLIPEPPNDQSALNIQGIENAIGTELTGHVLSGFQSFWKSYDPKLPSPDNDDAPEAYVGLVGLTLAVERGLRIENLSSSDAERAARYGLYQQNGWPSWYSTLVMAFPAQTETAIRGAIELEWTSHVAARRLINGAAYRNTEADKLVRKVVSALLDHTLPKNRETLQHALQTLLVSPRDNARHARIVQRIIETKPAPGRDALLKWLRIWAHLAPHETADYLDQAREQDSPAFERLLLTLSDTLADDFVRGRRLNGLAAWLPAACERWVPMLFATIRPAEDIRRPSGISFSPGERDGAQNFRDACLSMLAQNPSLDAYNSLRRLQSHEAMREHSEVTDWYTTRQLQISAEHMAVPWSEADILTVERGDERIPRTQAELFVMVQRHLRRLARMVENSDSGYATLFRDDTPEREIQLWAASTLELISKQYYRIHRESEVQHQNKPDIAVDTAGVFRIPIEVKPLYQHKYSINELKVFIETQLLGHYMKPDDAERGVFLLVPLVTRTWKSRKQQLSYEELVAELRQYASLVAARAGKEIAVLDINIAKARTEPQDARGVSVRSRKRTRRT